MKYLEQAAAIVGNKRSRRLAKRAGALAGRLGDDHDLAALQAKLAALSGPSKAERKLIVRIEARRAKLQKKALKRARRLYRKKPTAFVERLLEG